MYALIYDKHEPTKRRKLVLSVHRNRATSEKALEKQQKILQRRVWECNCRIVWVEGRVRPGDYITPESFSTWRPGEKIPKGEMYSDTD